MKKLLLLLLISSSSFLTAQVLQADDFQALTVGNIGTDLTGVAPGQGNWLTFNAAGGTNGSNDNYQIVNAGGTNVNALQLTGSNAATGTRYLWKDGLVTSWAGRTSGNDIIEVEFDFNPSVASTSNNSFRLYIYSDEASPKVLAGIGIATNAVVSTVSYANVVTGFGHWTSTPGTGTYSFGLGADAATPITLAASTWVRMGFSFNKTTGEIKWKGPGFDAAFTGNAPTFPVVTAGLNPGEFDFLVVAGTSNTVADVAMFDNLVVRASATNTLLGTEEVSRTNAFSIYPNPASNLVNVSSTELLIRNIELTDINGRVVKKITNDDTASTQVDLTDLAKGVYLLKITSNDGFTSTKKIIKE
jgi:hypothetical protein